MLVADYLNILKREIGVKEGANNKVKYSDELHGVEPRIDKNAPWCQAFLSWGKWIQETGQLQLMVAIVLIIF